MKVNNIDISNIYNCINKISNLDWEFINTFAPWVSAIVLGYLSYLNYRLLKNYKVIKVKSIFDIGMIPSNLYERKTIDRNVFILNFRNEGIKKIRITNFNLVVKRNLFKYNHLVLFPQLDISLEPINIKFPLLLEEGDSKDIFFDENFFLNLKSKMKNLIFHKNKLYTWYKLKTAYFILRTTM